MARILITNGGTHSADKWAVTTAEMIFPLDDTAMVGEHLIAAQKFQTQLAEVLSPIHGNVLSNEKSKCEDSQHFTTGHDASEHVDHAMEEIMQVAGESPWKEHFDKPEVQSAIRDIVVNHMHSAQHVERLWHASHNPSEEGDRYLAYHGAR